MKPRRRIAALVFAAIVAVVVVWGAELWPSPGTSLPRPKAFVTTRYPPVTDEEKALWDWWNKMRKIDPAFEWKMPIDFYGKVLDQYDQPVAGAQVEVVVSAIGGTPRSDLVTDRAGQFSLTGRRGKVISVSVLADGYVRLRSAMQHFEYAEFFNEAFHQPDPSKPVVFRLHKLGKAEPMYLYRFNGDAFFSGPPWVVDATKGVAGGAGDFAFSVRVEADSDKIMPGYSIEVAALSGAGLVRTDEEIPVLAPEAGYEASLKIVQPANAERYRGEQQFKFYARTRDGGFSLVEVTMYLDPRDKRGQFTLTIYRNARGSRNLEFDHNKWLNR